MPVGSSCLCEYTHYSHTRVPDFLATYSLDDVSLQYTSGFELY